MARGIAEQEAKNDAEAEAETKTEIATEGEPNVTRPITEPSGASVDVSGQPSTDVPPAEGTTETELGGVASTGSDVADTTVGEGKKPDAVAEANDKAKLEAADKAFEEGLDLAKYFETRRKFTDKLDEVYDEIAKYTDDVIELGSVRAASVLGEDGKPLVLDENGNYDSDKRRDAEKRLGAKRDESNKAFNDIIKQIDDLDAAQSAKNAAKKLTAEERIAAQRQPPTETKAPAKPAKTL